MDLEDTTTLESDSKFRHLVRTILLPRNFTKPIGSKILTTIKNYHD